jgi:catechol 2,3-dioxygenase-like lactoylglutathione lyase family enzyme
MTAPPFVLGSLGEIAIRCRDYAAMVRFYRDVLGLSTMASPLDGLTFFALAPGYQGHTQVLALFRHNLRREGETIPLPSAGEPSTLHHLALGIASADQDAAADWLKSQGYPATFELHAWIGWRGLFTVDPDGNSVELVAKL